jgi:hypothetical protein
VTQPAYASSQRPLRVRVPPSACLRRMAGDGALLPLPGQATFDRICPFADLDDHPDDRARQVVRGHLDVVRKSRKTHRRNRSQKRAFLRVAVRVLWEMPRPAKKTNPAQDVDDASNRHGKYSARPHATTHSAAVTCGEPIRSLAGQQKKSRERANAPAPFQKSTISGRPRVAVTAGYSLRTRSSLRLIDRSSSHSDLRS